MTGKQRLRRWISDECPDRGLAESARVSGRFRLRRVSQFRRWCRESLQLPWARQILILAGPLPLHRTVQQRCWVMGEWQVAGRWDNDHALLPHLPGLALNGRSDRVRSWNLGSKAAKAVQLATSGRCGLEFCSQAHSVPSAARDQGRTSAEWHDLKHIKTSSEFWLGSPPDSIGPIGESRRASSILGKSQVR